MNERKRAVGIFDNSITAETALQKLDNSHFSLDRVYVIARNPSKETELVGSELCESLRDCEASRRHRFEEKISSMAKSNSHNFGDTISLATALIELDIPINIARQYNDMVAQGKYLVMIEGSQEDISGAKMILHQYGIQDWVVYKVVVEHLEVIIVDRPQAA